MALFITLAILFPIVAASLYVLFGPVRRSSN